MKKVKEKRKTYLDVREKVREIPLCAHNSRGREEGGGGGGRMRDAQQLGKVDKQQTIAT
jgi:hypothetical protein